MSFTIRPLCETDYAALAAVDGTIYDNPVSAESKRREAETRDPRCLQRYWLAEADGQVVGFGEYAQNPGRYHPRKFWVGVGVLPAFRQRGIGAALYETVREALAALDPISLTSSVREDWPEAVAFAERRGFGEVLRNWESRLDLTTFNPAAFSAVVAEAQALGYEFRSCVDLAEMPDLHHRLHALSQETRRDVPSPDPLTDVPFEQWVKGLQSPDFLPEGYWVALKDGEFVGMSTVWRTDDPQMLKTGLTAVRREHRGSGVAKALKVCALAAAKAAGYTKVKTWNATYNHGMLAINGWLGFERRPAWIAYKLQIHPEE